MTTEKQSERQKHFHRTKHGSNIYQANGACLPQLWFRRELGFHIQIVISLSKNPG